MTNTITPPLTSEERKLLKEAAGHAKAQAPNFIMKADRVPYDFEKNLQDHGRSIVDADHKAKWNTALEHLLSDGLLTRVNAAHNQSSAFEVTDKGIRALEEWRTQIPSR